VHSFGLAIMLDSRERRAHGRFADESNLKGILR
jgi:hypothetical protein